MNSEFKKVLFIVNKYSGTGYQAAVEGKIIEACQENRVHGTIEFTRSQGHATTLSREAITSGFTSVIAVGGDGTVNEVAQGLLYSRVPMGIIPKGSGNGLARHLSIPIRLTGALKCLFTSRPIAMDAFQMNGKLSLNVSGIGFDGHIAELFGADKRRGFQAYTTLSLNEFIAFPEFDAQISIGDKILDKKAFVIAIANSSQYGNNAKIAPSASISDNLLNVSILKKMPPYRLDFIYSFFTGTINQSAYCEILEARNIVIQLKSPVAFHIDGEPCGKSDRFVIEIVPASLQLLVPSNVVSP